MEKTQLVSDDTYEKIAMDFQWIQVMEVDEALQAAGIEDLEKRKQICKRFIFGMSNFFDQYWFRSEDVKYYPLLCFSRYSMEMEYTDEGNEVDEDEGEEGDCPSVTELGEVYATAEYWSAHEYSGGAVERYFEGEKVTFGLLGRD